jgi:hypothetical protein
MNRFADVMAGLRKRASSEKIMKTLEGLEILNMLEEGDGKKPRMRLPYSSDPRTFEEPWK